MAETTAGTSRARRVMIALVGLAVATVFGGVAFFRPGLQDGHFHLTPRATLGDLLPIIAAIPARTMALLLLCMGASLPLRALQIRITARAVYGTPRFAPLLRAAGANMVGQNLLPAKIGEAARFVVLRQDARIPFPVALAASGVDRSLDLLGSAVCTIFLPFAFNLPITHVPELREKLLIVGPASTAVAAAIVLTLRQHAIVSRLLGRRLPRIAALVESFGAGARYASEPRRLLYGLCTSSAILVLYSAGVLLALHALGIQVPAGAPLVLTTMIFYSSAIPNAPSGLGVFHATVLLGLHMMGVAAKPALAMAILMHGADVLGTTLAGAVAFATIPGTRIRWTDVTTPLSADAGEGS